VTLTVSQLETARDELVMALARGVTSVRDQNGEQVDYATPGAMQRALNALESRIAAMQSAAPNVIKFS
ncbi:unnamed protein product, partial [Phaeothamnion confervicola]